MDDKRNKKIVKQLYDQFIERQRSWKKRGEYFVKSVLAPDYKTKYPFSFKEAMYYLERKEEELIEQEKQLQNEIQQLKSKISE